MQKHSQQARSWYEHTAGRSDYPRLDRSLKTDVCVIGGGYTGLAAALELAKGGVGVVLLEQNRVGCGASGSNGGQFFTGLHRDQMYLERKYGQELARDFWDIAVEAKQYLHDLCKSHNIDYMFQPGQLILATKNKSLRQCEMDAEHLASRYSYSEIEIFDRARCRDFIASDFYVGGMHDRGAGHVHPLRMALGLADAARSAGATIYENSAVADYQERSGKVVVRTASGTVEADQAIIACNGYIGKLQRRIASRIMVVNDFLIATEPLGDLADELIPGNQSVSDTNYHLNYFRIGHDRRLLFAGGASTRDHHSIDIPARLIGSLNRVFPQLSGIGIEFEWSGTLAITMPQLPDLGVLNGRVYYSHGYSGFGVVLAPMCGRILAEAVLGRPERLDIMKRLRIPQIPGGQLMRKPVIAAGMAFYRVLDAL